jgi:hypothetical protein
MPPLDDNQANPSPSEVRRAKEKAVGGKRKRCVKGKSCSAACIQPTDACLVEMPDVVASSISKTRDKVSSKPESKPKSLSQEVSELGVQVNARMKELNSLREREKELESKDISFKVKKVKSDEAKKVAKGLKEIKKEIDSKNEEFQRLLQEYQAKRDELRAKLKQAKPEPKAKPEPPAPKVVPQGRDIFFKLARKQTEDWEISGDVDPKKIDWEGMLVKGKSIGKGEYAEAFAVDKTKLNMTLPANKFQNGIVLKKGEIGDYEPDALKRAGEAGIAPRLIGARVSFQKAYNSDDALYNGLLAMERLGGQALYKFPVGSQVGGKDPADIYWATKAKLHKLGIAHNDSHNNNFMIDPSGKGKFIDFGLAVISPKNALSEALGGPTGSDKQSAPREGRVFNRIVKNLPAVKDAMAQDGFSEGQIKSFLKSGNSARPLVSGVWKDMTDEQAGRYLDILYSGLT